MKPALLKRDGRFVLLLYEYGFETAFTSIILFAAWMTSGLEAAILFVFIGVVLSLVCRAPTQILLCGLRRMHLARQGRWHPWRSIGVVAFWWPVCCVAVFMGPKFTSRLFAEGEVFVGTLDSWYDGLMFFSPFYAASLLAPLLVYRITGYLFDADFSQPPWSHGKWGFEKPATVPVNPQPQ